MIADSTEIVNDGITGAELSGADEAYRLEIADSLSARGFTIVPLSNNPDLVLNITKIKATSDGEVDSSSYWQNYNSYYNPSLYNYPGLTYTENLDKAPVIINGEALSFEILDLKNAGTLNTIKIIWDGLIDGTAPANNMDDAQPAMAALLAASGYLVSH